ncbi:hypothetical protein EV183_005130 [Coemansia sp. RSA 2336]|nr:hypothetical protein EV183_005130 [Coemansia sp. RSA 2336]
MYSGKLGELYSAYSRVVGRWPVDQLRPTHCYKKVLKQQMAEKFAQLSKISGPQLNPKLQRIEREISALNSLLDSKHKAQYKLSESILDPASNRGYYTKLLESIDRAAKSTNKGMLRVD